MERTTTNEVACTILLEYLRVEKITDLYERGKMTREQTIEQLRVSQAAVEEVFLRNGMLEHASRTAKLTERLNNLATGRERKTYGNGTN